jgi:hypothetical protein
LAEAIKSQTEYELPKPPHGWRVYRPHTLGPWYVVIWEMEFENVTEYDAWFKELVAAPRLREWIDLRRGLVADKGGGEVWTVESFE